MNEKKEKKLSIELPKDQYSPLFRVLHKYIQDPLVREVWIYGGKGSAKSFSVAQILELMMVTQGESSLCFRKEGTTIKTTLKGTFVKALQSFDMNLVTDVLDFEFRNNKRSNARIVFRGLDEPKKVKGAEGFKYFFLDELDQFTDDDYTETTGALRGNLGAKIFATWNPVSIEHFIKKKYIDIEEWEFTDDVLPSKTSFVKRSLDKSKLLIKTTYPDNYWAVGSPCETYGFHDFGYLRDLERRKSIDPEWYDINVMGNWGVPRLDRPFYNNLVVRKVEDYDQNKPIYVSFDFNMSRGCACVVAQKSTNNVFRVIWCYQQPNEDFRAVLPILIGKFCKFNKVINITGDAEGGDNRVQQYYRQMQIQALPLGAIVNYFVPSRNIEHKNGLSRQQIQNLFYANRVIISEELTQLLNDMKAIEATIEGGFDKAKLEKMGIGDLSDAFRYLCDNVVEKENFL